MSHQERTGWRDEELSRRHRQWGADCPAVDVDLLFLEYNHALPIAFIEYKHHRAQLVDFNSPSIVAMEIAADRASLCYFIAIYWPGDWSFLVFPANANARKFLGGRTYLSERMFVELLYRIRDNEIRKYVSDKLSTVVIPQNAAIVPIIIPKKTNDGDVIRFRDVV